MSDSQPSPDQLRQLQIELETRRHHDAQRDASLQQANEAARLAQAELEQLRRAAAANLNAAAAAAPSRHAIKAPVPDKFIGTVGFTCDTWLRTLERLFEFYGAEYAVDKVEKRLAVAAAYLSGAAETWWANLQGADAIAAKSSWASFCECLRTRFRPVQAAELARSRLRVLRQLGSLTAYIESFHVELAPVQTDMAANDQIFYFVEGLKERRLVNKIKELKPATLHDAIQDAVEWEARFNPSSSSNRAAYYPQTPFYRSSGSSSSSQPRSSSSGGDPMELSAVAGSDMNGVDDGSAPSGDAGVEMSVKDRYFIAMLEKMEKKINNLAADASSHSSSSSSRVAAMHQSAGNDRRTPGLKPGDIDRLRRERRCFQCKDVGHMKNECTKPLRLKW